MWEEETERFCGIIWRCAPRLDAAGLSLITGKCGFFTNVRRKVLFQNFYPGTDESFLLGVYVHLQ